MKISVSLICACVLTAIAQTPGTLTATGNMITPRSGHTATVLPDGRVLITGGNVSGFIFRPTDSAEIYDPSTGAFSATGSMTVGRYGHTATLLPNGTVLIAGGAGGIGGWGLSAELYNPLTGTFAATGSMAGFHLRATLLSSGKVLMEGGSAHDDLYDPSTRTFTPTAGDLSGYTDTLLADGRVLTSANSPSTLYDAHSHAELYDPATGTYSLTGAMIYAFADLGRSATLLMNGKVLFAGGEIDRDFTCEDILPPFYSFAELYDPSAGNFTATGRMTEARWSHAATLLPDGKVLITGNADPGSSTTAELYDSSTGTFSSIGSMIARRSDHTATLLNDGRVLIAGGSAQVSNLGPVEQPLAAELYTPSVLVPAPALLSLSSDGKGQGAIQHAGTARIASADDPAVAGEILSIYLNGLADGSVIPPQVAVGGKPAEITFFGNVPGYPGLNVVNVRVPSATAAGTAVPVRLTYLGRPSNEVTIGVTDALWQEAILAMKAAAGTNSLNFWRWAWYWQYLPAFSGPPAGFGAVGSISPDVMEQIITAGGGDPLLNISAEQRVLDFRQVVPR